MKVTISFDGTKIVVPCGDGEITVRELTNLAVTRYKKVIGKPNNFWVSVSNLKSCVEGGMLDPDDLICDVCDDREQLVAIFEEQGRTGLPGDHHGDGMSSEDSSDSKDMQKPSSTNPPSFYDNVNQNCQGRRGSEPNVALRPTDKTINNNHNVVTSGIVQAAVANFNAITSKQMQKLSPNSELSTYGSVGRSFSAHILARQSQTTSGSSISQPDFFIRPSPTRSSTDNGRSSLRMSMMQGGNNSRNEEYLKVYNFSDDSETLDSLNFDSKCSLNVMRRRDPLGASGNKPEKPRSPVFKEPFPKSIESQKLTEEIIIPNENGPLGIHVVPCDSDGRLVVQGIEPGGRIDRQGHLAVGDEIISINGLSLTASSFTHAQEIFKEALSSPELRLEVLKLGVVATREEMAVEGDDKENQMDLANNPKSPITTNLPRFFDASTSTTGTLTKMPAGTKITAAVNANNTRKIGKVMQILLQKGPLGLGFSITTRDNAPGGSTPIYIKNILPKGAAIEEGSLKPGDRLLEVNGVSVDGKSQSDVVALLRNAQPDSLVKLVVSRHIVQPGLTSPGKAEDEPANIDGFKDKNLRQQQKNDENQVKLMEPSNPPPMCTSPLVSSSEEQTDDFQFPWKQREILTFDIPVHDSERAGLGVSVKGKTSTSKDGSVVDLGIFVKSVLHGGAASRDGRLETNDQLVNINGISLLGKHNPSAMETLRKAMHEEGPVPGIISLTVARRRNEDYDWSKPSSSSLTSDANSYAPYPDYQHNHLHQLKKASPNNQEIQLPEGLKRRDSLSSLVTSSSDDMIREYNVQPPPRQQQEEQQMFRPNQQFVFHPPSFPMSQSSTTSLMSSSLKNVRNPVVDRLMGKDSASAALLPSNLRNDSYYMATHQETWNGTHMHHHLVIPPQRIPNSGPPLPPQSTMHPMDQGDAVIMIEQDQIDFLKPVRRDEIIPMNENDEDESRTASTTRESLTSLVELYPGFSRDQPGRQSMSEKRHATLDAKSTDTYQKRKKAREDKAKEKEHQRQLLKKKSASLESLQMITSKYNHLGAEERDDIRNAYVRANSVRVARNRGCNESFRAAVDRSYEKDFPDAGQDFAIEDVDPEGSPEQVQDIVVMRRSKSERDTPSRKKNRNSKLFRGLGTMFRLNSKTQEGSEPVQVQRRSKSSSSTNRKSMPVPGPIPSPSDDPMSNIGPSGSNSNSTDYRQNFMLKSKSGDLALLQSRQLHQHHHQQQQQLHPPNKRQAPPPPPFMTGHIRPPAPGQHFHRRPDQQVYAYEYFPSAMMRPGSRVGIADPAQLSTESADYDVIHRLQNSRPQQEPTYPQRYNPVYETAYGGHTHSHRPQQHGVYLGTIPSVHTRTGSNLSSGSSTQNNHNTSGGSDRSGGGGMKLPQRPKSNYFDYDYHNQFQGHHQHQLYGTHRYHQHN